VSGAPSERTRVRRLPKRARYERDEVRAILREGLICHLGFAVDGRPYVIPTSYGLDGDTLYLHGSSASRALRALGRGVEASVAVTLLDGVVLARSGFHHSYNYRSVVLFGVAEPVEEPERKLAALRAFVEHAVPGRWDEVRGPSERELRATSVLALDLEEAAAKVRSGPPIDDDEDYGLPVWAGVVPLGVAVGAPEPDPRLADGIPLPPYAADYRGATGR
jgi:uncharacterized protein